MRGSHAGITHQSGSHQFLDLGLGSLRQTNTYTVCVVGERNLLRTCAVFLRDSLQVGYKHVGNNGPLDDVQGKHTEFIDRDDSYQEKKKKMFVQGTGQDWTDRVPNTVPELLT